MKTNNEITLNLIFLFYNGCKTWSFGLTKEHRLMMFENRVLEKTIWTQGRSKRSLEETA